MTSASWQKQQGGGDSVKVHRIIEVATVLLLALATVGSAWCAYQVSQWNGAETDAARISAAARIDGSREYALATQKVAYDAASVAQYAEAVVAENERLQAFLRASIIRPEFLPMVDAWEALIAETGEAPPNLVEDEAYLSELFAVSNEYDEAALAATLEGEDAGRNAEDYILTTLFMASALFFAGVTASFSTRFTKIVLLTASVVTLGVAAARIASYPIA